MKSNREQNPIIGEIYLVNFNGTGNEQKGIRPGLIFQNNLGNVHSPNIIVLPLTSSIKKESQPTHVFIPSTLGLRKDSLVLCENPERMSKNRLGIFITKLPDEYMSKIAIASILATAAISFIEPDDLMAAWQQSVKLNRVA